MREIVPPVGCIEVKVFQDSAYKTVFATKSGFVRFHVDPPIRISSKGTPVKLREGYIDVRINEDGDLEISGAGPLDIHPNLSNSFTISLRDDKEKK